MVQLLLQWAILPLHLLLLTLSSSSPPPPSQHHDTHHHHHHHMLRPPLSSSAQQLTTLSPQAIIAFAHGNSIYSPVKIICPVDRMLFPCNCHHNERITCTKSGTYSIGHVFKGISRSAMGFSTMNSDSLLYKEFILSNHETTELESNLFHSVRFKKITLVDMVKLKHIKKDAFNGTASYVQSFDIKGKNLLGLKHLNELFDALSTLVNAREMNLELDNLRSIPTLAFRNLHSSNSIDSSNGDDKQQRQQSTLRLERLHIKSRSLTQIESYAFNDLALLQSIKIHSTAGLQRISAHAFDIAQPSYRELVIDLHSNQLTVESFERDAFPQVGRPVNLKLSHNNLTTVDHETFERFLIVNQQNKMHLTDNPLECDCSMHWILKNRPIYFNQILGAICGDFADLWSLDENAFGKCANDMNYMPRLIFRNSAIQLFAFFARYLLLLPLTLAIQWIL